VAEPPPPGRPVIVATDFDETISDRDCVIPFMFRVAGRGPFLIGLLRRLPRLVTAVVRRDRNAIRAVGTESAFTGRHHAVVERIAREWGREIVGRHLRDDVVARIAWHLGEGHRVVIVSASYEPYLRVVGEHLGVHGIVGTQLEVGADGRCTGGLAGPNCRAAEKVVRLDAWLAAQGLSRDGVTLWAYGDSAGDRQLLAAADHPVWAREPLASVAPTS
jgi:phosphatidylglycerophosphatase C